MFAKTVPLRTAAIVGLFVWLVLAALAATGVFPAGLPDMLLLLAPLVVVPLGFELYAARAVDREGLRWLRAATQLAPVGASLAVASFAIRPGPLAAAFASGWLLVTALAAMEGALRLARRRGGPLCELAFDAALLFLPIGGTWFVLSREGRGFMGFDEPIVLLTAVHFHFAGFAASLIAASLGDALRDAAASWRPAPSRAGLRRWYALATATVIAGPLMLAAGFALHAPTVKLASAWLIAAGLIATAALEFRALPRVNGEFARALIALSAASVFVGMLFAAAYAWGEFTGRELLTIPQMAALHGIANGLGFSLCGLAGWVLAGSRVANAGADGLHDPVGRVIKARVENERGAH